MPSSLEHKRSPTPLGDKINPDPKGREAYDTVGGIRLKQVASVAGVVNPGRTQETRRLDVRNLDRPGEYHIPV